MTTISNISTQLIDSFESDGYTNRLLTKFEIANKLADHGVSHCTTDSGELIAEELFSNGDVSRNNTTGWTLFDLLDFLNY